MPPPATLAPVRRKGGGPRPPFNSPPHAPKQSDSMLTTGWGQSPSCGRGLRVSQAGSQHLSPSTGLPQKVIRGHRTALFVGRHRFIKTASPGHPLPTNSPNSSQHPVPPCPPSAPSSPEDITASAPRPPSLHHQTEPTVTSTRLVRVRGFCLGTRASPGEDGGDAGTVL